MRATKIRRYASSENSVNTSKTARYSVEKSTKKGKKKFRILSVALGVALAAVTLIVPTTTLAPDVNAFADTKAAAYSVGDVDKFAVAITNNCVVETTIPETEVVTTQSVTKATESTKQTEKKENKEVATTTATEPTAKATEPVEKVEETKPVKVKETKPQSTPTYSTGYLIGISNPDYNYSPKPVTLSSYDRAKLERLVMGEAGSLGFNGAALVAQSIRDSMNLSNTTSIDWIINEYQYYAPTDKEPTQTVKDAVSYIFDSNGSAVQHRILCFYTGVSEWHETQEFIVGCGNVRFFDYND